MKLTGLRGLTKLAQVPEPQPLPVTYEQLEEEVILLRGRLYILYQTLIYENIISERMIDATTARIEKEAEEAFTKGSGKQVAPRQGRRPKGRAKAKA